MSEHLISMHKETIIGYLIYLWIILIFLVVMCMILGRIGHGKLHIKYSKECFLIIIVVLLGYGAIKTTQGVIDINTEAYVIEEDVEYSKFYTQKAFFGDPIHISTKNGVGMVLYTVDDYPDGEYIGTVTYAKNSKIILDFRVMTTSRAGGLHLPPWGVSHTEPIGSSNDPPLVVVALPPQMWQLSNHSLPQWGKVAAEG